jgi:hypothetical protein
MLTMAGLSRFAAMTARLSANDSASFPDSTLLTKPINRAYIAKC